MNKTDTAKAIHAVMDKSTYDLTATMESLAEEVAEPRQGEAASGAVSRFQSAEKGELELGGEKFTLGEVIPYIWKYFFIFDSLLPQWIVPALLM